MRYLLLILALVCLPAPAAEFDFGEGLSNRQRASVGWDYTFDSPTPWHWQANTGFLLGLGVPHAGPNRHQRMVEQRYPNSHLAMYYELKDREGALVDRLTLTHTVYWGASLLYETPRFFAGVGVIELNADTPHLTSKYQFLDDLGVRLGRYRLMI